MCVTCLFLSLFPAPPLPCFPSLSRVVLPVSVEEVSDIYRDITQDYLESNVCLNPVQHIWHLQRMSHRRFMCVVSCGQFAFVWDAYWDRIAFVRELWCWCDRLVLVSVETEPDRALSSAFKSLCHHALNRNHIFCAQVFWCSYSPATPKYQTTFLFSEPRTDIHRHHTLAPFQSLF